MLKNIRPKLLILLVLAVALLNFPLSVPAQKLKNGETYWNWKTTADKDNFQLDLELSLKIKGKKVRGAFVFSNLINGEWDDSDRDITPFVGTIKGNVIWIEFDPNDIRNNEEYDSPFAVVYRRPKNKSVSRARIKITRGKLELMQTSGKSIFAISRKIIMRQLT